MIYKRVNIFRRTVKSEPGNRVNDNHHIEKVVRESWWLFGFIPLYIRDSVHTNNL